MNPNALGAVALACCPFLGAGAVLVLDPATSTPPAVTAEAPVTDAPVPPLLVQEPTVEPTTAPPSERPAAVTARHFVADLPQSDRTATPTPTATARPAPTPTPRPTATATPEPVEPAPAEPEPGPVWTAADQAAADARCAAAYPAGRAENTPKIGDTYDPDVQYPCSAPGR